MYETVRAGGLVSLGPHIPAMALLTARLLNGPLSVSRVQINTWCRREPRWNETWLLKVVPYHRQWSSPGAGGRETFVLPPEWQKEHSVLPSPRPLRQLSDREVLAFLHRALSDMQVTSAQSLATVSESHELIRLVEELSGPRYPSADDN